MLCVCVSFGQTTIFTQGRYHFQYKCLHEIFAWGAYTERITPLCDNSGLAVRD